MPKYIVPLVGSGTADDPVRPKYRPLKKKEPIIRKRTMLIEKKTGKPVTIFDIIEKGLSKKDVEIKEVEEKVGEREIYYNCHIDLAKGIAIFESEKEIKELEEKEDVVKE